MIQNEILITKRNPDIVVASFDLPIYIVGFVMGGNSSGGGGGYGGDGASNLLLQVSISIGNRTKNL